MNNVLRLKTPKGDANAYSERRERPSLGARGTRFQQNSSSVNDSEVRTQSERPSLEAARGATAFNTSVNEGDAYSSDRFLAAAYTLAAAASPFTGTRPEGMSAEPSRERGPEASRLRYH